MFNSGISCLLPVSRLLARQDQEVSQPDQDLDVLFPGNGTNQLENQGFSDFPHPDFEITKWDAGRMPEACFQMASDDTIKAGRCSIPDMEVYDVLYEDCDMPWIVCRCNDADEDVERLATDLGQLPVLARDNVNHVMMSEHTSVDGRDELEGISLYTQGDLVIYGNWSSVGLFVHESTHNLDWWIAGEGERMYSESSEWENIVDGDTCVADWYSMASYSEAYAQGAVLLAYDLNARGGLDDKVDFDCASGVHDKLEEQLGAYLKYDADATCQDRFPKARNVCIDDDGEAAYCTDDGSADADGNDDGDDDESSASFGPAMGSLPLAVFRGVAQVLRAVGMISGR